MGGMKDKDWSFTGSDHLAIGEADPLSQVLGQELVSNRPIVRFILAPVGMDLAGNAIGQSVGQAFHVDSAHKSSGNGSLKSGIIPGYNLLYFNRIYYNIASCSTLPITSCTMGMSYRDYIDLP